MRRILRAAALTAIGMMSLSAARAEVRYYSLLLNGKKAGYARIQEERKPEGLKVSSDCVIKVTMLGAPFDVRYQVIALYARPADALPKRYTMTLDSGPRKITSDSRFTPGKVEVDYSVNGVTERKSLKLPAKCYLIEGNLPETWERAFRSVRLSGKPVKATIFTPSAGALDAVTLRPEKPGRITADIANTPLHFVVNTKTGVLRSMNVPSQQARFQLADKQALTGIQGVEAASRAFAVSNVALDDAQRLDTLTVEIDAAVAGEAITSATLQLPRQTFTGTVKKNRAVGRLVIRKVHYDGKDAATLPLDAGMKKRHAAFLKAEAMTELDDPEIRALAAKLTEECKTTWEAAEKIGKWVHQNIAYKISGVGAKQCLKEKAGDCGPHSWLSIALLRAAGVPARITGGALYSDMLGGSFGQHYWTDVWTGATSGWIPIDTTTGEIGTLSPAHLNLWSRAGGIGSLSVKVVDYAPKQAVSTVADAEASPRHSMNLTPNETWEYTYTEGGKQMGKETARVVTVRPNGEAEIEYRIALDAQGNRVTISGKTVVRPDGTPVSLDLTVVQGAITQNVAVVVEGTKANAAIEAAGIKNSRATELPKGAYIGMAVSEFTWDLMFRSIAWEVGKPVHVAVYLVDGLRMEKLKLEPTREETLMIGERMIPCIVVRAGGHEHFFVEKATGRLIRSIPGGDKMTVERVAP